MYKSNRKIVFLLSASIPLVWLAQVVLILSFDPKSEETKKKLFVYTNIVSSDTCANVFSLHFLSIVLIFIQKLIPALI